MNDPEPNDVHHFETEMLARAGACICAALIGADEPAPGPQPGGNLLVTSGLSALPVLLTIEELRPNRVVLVRSKRTPVDHRSVKALGVTTVETVNLEDADDAAEIFTKVRQALNHDQEVTWDLAFTGGTKTMAVHAQRAWASLDAGRRGKSWYLDDDDLTLRATDGAERALTMTKRPAWRLEQVLTANDVQHIGGAPNAAPVRTLLAAGQLTAGDLVVAKHLFDALTQRLLWPTDLQALVAQLHEDILGQGINERFRPTNEGEGASFPPAQWFEHCVALLIFLTARIAHGPLSETYTPVRAWLRDPDARHQRGAGCEIDVAHVAGARLSAIEVKLRCQNGPGWLDDDLEYASQIEWRARQFGGSHAKAGYVTLRSEQDRQDIRAGLGRLHVSPIIDAPVEVFGLKDLQQVVDALLGPQAARQQQLARTAIGKWLAP